MELIDLVVSSILLFSGVTTITGDARFLSNETVSGDSEDSVQRAWSAFKTQHAKSYSRAVEDQRRRRIFEKSLEVIRSHNRLYAAGRSTYEMGINQFSDMELSEILEMTGYIGSNATDTDGTTEEEFPSSSSDSVPDSVDWRKLGYVTGVKNQGHCGSCWAFSATGSLEGQWKRKTGRLVTLSEQNLVDCSRPRGCSGGLVEQAYDYARRNGGIDIETCYPYRAKNGACRYTTACRGATVRGYKRVERGSEQALTQAIADIGPISVVIHVCPSFYYYSRGIYEDASSRTHPLIHAVLAVGYGISKEGAYYTVKNSWGVKWGEGGYVRMARNKGNMCGIANGALYPLV